MKMHTPITTTPSASAQLMGPEAAPLTEAGKPPTVILMAGLQGAGKTTTLRMVSGLLQPDEGHIEVFGVDVKRQPVEAKKIMAWVSDEPMIYDKLTPYEYLEFVAGLWEIDAKEAETRARELLGWLELEPHAHERCGGFSKGMRQKVALAGALVHEPRLIILDEPTRGVDVGAIAEIHSVINELADSGLPVVMISSYLPEILSLSDRILVSRLGRVVEEFSIEEATEEKIMYAAVH